MDYAVALVLVPRLRKHMDHKKAAVVCMVNKDMRLVWKEERDLALERFAKRGTLDINGIPREYLSLRCPVCQGPFLWFRMVCSREKMNGKYTGRQIVSYRHACTTCGYRWRTLR